MKQNANTPMTREALHALPADALSEICDAYYKTGEGILGLADSASHLGPQEQEAIRHLRRAFEALNHLGKHL
jgi:phosphotransferase system HPr-like phosphotransfer protein